MSRIAKRLALSLGVVGLYVIAAVSYDASPWATVWLMSAVAVLGIGTFVLLTGPRRPLNRAFFLFAICMGFYLLLVYALNMGTVWGMRNVSGAVWLLRNGNLLGPAALMYLAYRFVGGENRFLRALAWLSLASVLPFVVLNLAGLYVTEYRLAGAKYVPANALGLYFACAVVTSLWMLAFWLVLLVGAFLPSLRRRRAQFALFLAGSSLSIAAAVAAFIPAFAKVRFPVASVVAHIGFVGALGIGVLRFGMFDVRVVVRRTLPYAVGTVLIGGLYALYLGAVEAAGRSLGSVPTGAGWVVLFVLVGLGFQPLLESLKEALDRLFFRTEAELDRLLGGAGPRYRDAASQAAVARMLASDVETALKLESAAVFLGDEQVSDVLSDVRRDGLAGTRGMALPAPGEGLGLAVPDDAGRFDLGEDAAELSDALGKAGVSVAVPFDEGATRFLLVGGRRLSDLPVSPRDAMFLQALVAQAEMAMAGLRARQDADAATRLTEALFDVMENPVALVAPDGRVETGNPSFERTFGPAGHMTIAELGLGGLATTDAPSGPVEIETPKGTFLVSARPLDEAGGERKALVVMTDVTDLRRLQEAERRRSALAELGAAVSVINHEIMNILSPVDFYLRKAEAARAGEEGPAALAVVRQRLEALDRLCRDIRAFYRSPALSLRQVDLRDVIGSALSDLAQTEGAAWVPPRLSGLDVSVMADPQKLRQVIFNIAKNAWEAMQRDPEKTWSVDVSPSEDGHATIRIADSGTGIPPGLVNRLFEPFFTTKADRGSGLGLAVARRIAEAHGAEIGAQSVPGKGMTVTLRWPTARSAAASGSSR